MQGDDQALIDGLIFLLAVIKDIDPHSGGWNALIDRYGTNRQDLQDIVFEGKTRVLSDSVAAKFLRHYVGPKGYAEIEFPGDYQQHNDEMFDILKRTVGIRSASMYPR